MSGMKMWRSLQKDWVINNKYYCQEKFPNFSNKIFLSGNMLEIRDLFIFIQFEKMGTNIYELPNFLRVNSRVEESLFVASGLISCGPPTATDLPGKVINADGDF